MSNLRLKTLRGMSFKITDQEITDWLLSRKWLFYRTGYGRGLNAYFSYCPKDIGEHTQLDNGLLEIEGCTQYNTIHLDREPMGTYSHPRVALTIHEDNTFDYTQYQVKIGFKYAGDELDLVFDGFVRNLDELLQVLRFLGTQESFLTGDQKI
jgi:hypothetical protein